MMYIANIADVNCPVQLPEGASVQGLGVSISNLLGLFAKELESQNHQRHPPVP